MQGGDFRAAGAVIDGKFDFEVHWYPKVDLEDEFIKEEVLSCFLYKADYEVNVSYTNGTSSFAVEVNNLSPLNATNMTEGSGDAPLGPKTGQSTAIIESNVWAIYDAVVLAMSGSVARYG
jgi:hypothetical protein